MGSGRLRPCAVCRGPGLAGDSEQGCGRPPRGPLRLLYIVMCLMSFSRLSSCDLSELKRATRVAAVC